jgi:hypothetical protein
MMTWDEFDAKFDNICEKTDPNLRRIILDEFGEWKDLAFGILEMILWDRIKYNDISHSCTGEKQYGYNVVDAQSLARQLEQFKKDLK